METKPFYEVSEKLPLGVYAYVSKLPNNGKPFLHRLNAPDAIEQASRLITVWPDDIFFEVTS